MLLNLTSDGKVIDRFADDRYVNKTTGAGQGVSVLREDGSVMAFYSKASLGTYSIAAGDDPYVPPLPPLADKLPAWAIKYVLAGAPGADPGATLLDDATAAVASTGDQQAIVKFASFPEWFLTDPELQQIAAALGLSPDQFEAYWRQAMAL